MGRGLSAEGSTNQVNSNEGHRILQSIDESLTIYHIQQIYSRRL